MRVFFNLKCYSIPKTSLEPEAAFPPSDSFDTFPSCAPLAAEIGIDQPLAYPAGDGNAPILNSMAP